MLIKINLLGGIFSVLQRSPLMLELLNRGLWKAALLQLPVQVLDVQGCQLVVRDDGLVGYCGLVFHFNLGHFVFKVLLRRCVEIEQ